MDSDGRNECEDFNAQVQQTLCRSQLQQTCQLMVKAMNHVDYKQFCSADGIQRKPSESMQDYIDELLDQYDQIIEIFRQEPKGYIRKAAVLVLANKWTDARLTLGKGLMVCRDKDGIREALNRLNYVFRETESVKTATQPSLNKLNYHKFAKQSSLQTVEDEEEQESDE